jgi:hypothetical protein
VGQIESRLGRSAAPAPQGTEDLTDQLRYGIVLFEDCLLVSEGWADRARYGLGEAPVDWTEPP